MKVKKRMPTNGEPIVWTSPFATLNNMGLPPVPALSTEAAPCDAAPTAFKKNRGRVDIIRQSAHRGGNTVTVVSGFIGIALAEKETLAKEIQKSCGTGGTVKEGRIEIQGDQRKAVARILTHAGFRPVLAGG